MSFIIQATQTIRQNILDAISHLNTEQLHQIPTPLSNNLIWNVGHVVATQQILCYKLANQNMLIPVDFIELYKKGSSPKSWIGLQDIEIIKSYLKLTSDAFENDYNSKKLNNYSEYATSSGIVLKTIEDAIIYNYGHENLHYGSVLNLRKLV